MTVNPTCLKLISWTDSCGIQACWKLSRYAKLATLSVITRRWGFKSLLSGLFYLECFIRTVLSGLILFTVEVVFQSGPNFEDFLCVTRDSCYKVIFQEFCNAFRLSMRESHQKDIAKFFDWAKIEKGQYQVRNMMITLISNHSCTSSTHFLNINI